jgi:sugar O-acyltransferase (sialic acid O-acetyltransferase NeuD family)
MEKRIVIFGAGGFGREVLQLIRDINRIHRTWNCLGFIVDSSFNDRSSIHGLPILGGSEWLANNPDVQIIVAVGSSSDRWRITNRIRSQCDNSFAVLIHPRAWVGDNVEIGCGSVVCAGALITTDIKIAQHVHVNIGSTVGHDAQLGNFVTLNPSVNISGKVTLHTGTEVGTGSVVIPACTIGEWSIIGAGSVVTKSIKENCTAVGAPARIIKERTSGWQENQLF